MQFLQKKIRFASAMPFLLCELLRTTRTDEQCNVNRFLGELCNADRFRRYVKRSTQFLAEDSVSAVLLHFRSLPLSPWCPSSGRTKSRLFLVFRYYCESGKVGSTISYKSAFGSHGSHSKSLHASPLDRHSSHTTKWNSSWVICFFFIFTLIVAPYLPLLTSKFIEKFKLLKIFKEIVNGFLKTF